MSVSNKQKNRHDKVYAYVLNMREQPLMPTTPRKARMLLKEGKANVINRCPFIIQLHYATGETTQPIKLGIDMGFMKMGFSAKTDKQEVISGNVKLRNDVSQKLDARRRYRRNRRGRLWYRKARYLNRTRPDGWLSPSNQHRVETHIRLVSIVESILPITTKRTEVASFDTQQMQNPEIEGVGYQHGTLHGYEVKEYLLEKWGRKCAYCGKSDVPLEVEHIVPKSRGGSDRVSNLTISCTACNLKKGPNTAAEFGFPAIQKHAKKPLKEAAAINSIRWRIVEALGSEYTFGYVTKYERNKLGLKKSDINDAFVIAGGTDQERCRPYEVKHIRRNNRSLQKNRKGFKPSIRRQKYMLQPHDLVNYDGKLCTVKSVFNYGKWVRLSDSNGEVVNTNIKNVELLKYGKGVVFSLLNTKLPLRNSSPP